MDDVSEYFKSGFLNLHKNAIGKSYQQKTLRDRLSNFNDMRRETRNTLMFQKRQINENMTPLSTPEPVKNIKQAVYKEEEKKPNKRLDMLQKWKMKKEKQKQEQKQKAKPVFKVCHVPMEVGLPDLENVNKKIKGKPIKSILSQRESQFAPPNHKFHAPKNIKPIPIKSASNSSVVKSNNMFKTDITLNSPDKNKHISSRLSKENIVLQRNTRATTRKIQLEANKLNGTESNKKCATDLNKKNLQHINNQTQKVNATSAKNKTVISKVREETKSTKITPSKSNVKKSTSEKTPAEYIVNSKSVPKNALNKVSVNKSDDKYLSDKLTAADYVTRNKRGNRNVSSVRATPRKSKVVGVSNEMEIKFDYETKVKSSTKSPRKKNVAWNQIEVVGEQLPSVDINTKTPKATSKKYNKTPRKKRNSPKCDEKFIRKCTNEGIENCDSSTPKHNTMTPNKRKKNNSQNELMQLGQLDYNINSINSVTNSAAKSASPDYPLDTILSEVNSSFRTPLKDSIQEESPVYVSPFVTVSRGKTSARKEYQVRHSAGLATELNVSTLNNTSPKVGADYFSKKLNNEISRIEDLCYNWDNYKDSEGIPEEAVDMINVAIGQSRLLISKKFQQFRNLIEECRKCEFREKPVTCEDLHGFWDMIYMQVEDLNKRFDNLDVLKANNWQEIIPEKKVTVKRGRGRPKKASASAALKNLIRAARNIKKTAANEDAKVLLQTEESKVFDGGYYSVKSPITDLTGPKIQNVAARRSLRVSLLANQATKRLSSSPGLTMMKISQAIKCGNGITPSKSILKNSVTKSSKKITKSVLFRDDLENPEIDSEGLGTKEMEDIINKENDVNEINLISFSPATPVRRSKRLSSLNK